MPVALIPATEVTEPFSINLNIFEIP